MVIPVAVRLPVERGARPGTREERTTRAASLTTARRRSRASRGCSGRRRTLVLFTSRNPVVRGRRPPAGVALDDGASRCWSAAADMGRASRRAVRREPRAVLLGRAACGRGSTFRGSAVCVVIDKLPFPPPNDPLQQGRGRRDPVRPAATRFRALSLEPAGGLVKQMFGRLVRTGPTAASWSCSGRDPSKALASRSRRVAARTAAGRGRGMPRSSARCAFFTVP